MIYPTIQELTKGKYNRYQLAIATAKCARIITDEYDEQRKAAEKVLTGSKEGASSIASLIDPALADEKVQRQMQGMQLVKTIVVKNRIVNLIVKKA